MKQLHIDILGTSNFRWTGIRYFESEDQTVYYLACEKEGKVLHLRGQIIQ